MHRKRNLILTGIAFVLSILVSNAQLPLNLAIQMANSEMARNTQAWQIDFVKSPKWAYTNGLVGLSFERLSWHTGDQKYIEYFKNSYVDVLVDDKAIIKGYKKSDFNLDNINSGKLLFYLYDRTGDLRYRIVIDSLMSQLVSHPRTSEGGFWHKQHYPHQMWLDGVYMAQPFVAQYAKFFNKPELFNDVVHQITTIQKHTFDTATGLNYHAWDESHSQTWADKTTGCSPQFWGRAQGWYLMAIVDVLDYLPNDHPGRTELINILQKALISVLNVKDKKTGVWHQILDQGGRDGNYLESTCSAMFTYCLIKSVRKGYLGNQHTKQAIDTYNSVVKQFIRNEKNGTLSITSCCSVAGLGGNPYRDGSFAYYISEPIRDNDPKAVGPFILASVELEKLNNVNTK